MLRETIQGCSIVKIEAMEKGRKPHRI